ncbi:hypothetical protein F5H01DRAFT_60293 [Linnemannia elongata]|nr:hypothetical protein F5H01DRAFT_60293 [Linnemannia elongata]
MLLLVFSVGVCPLISLVLVLCFVLGHFPVAISFSNTPPPLFFQHPPLRYPPCFFSPPSVLDLFPVPFDLFIGFRDFAVFLNLSFPYYTLKLYLDFYALAWSLDDVPGCHLLDIIQLIRNFKVISKKGLKEPTSKDQIVTFL